MTITKKEDEYWPEAWFEGKDVDNDERVWYVETDDDVFHIGQCYENTAAKLIKCAICDGTEFNVGNGSYFTAIRCVKCEWEICFHNG